MSFVSEVDSMNRAAPKSRQSGVASSATIDKYSHAILSRVWSLSPHFKKLLTYRQTYLSTVSQFLDNCENENYPITYEDVFLLGGKRYYISYLFTSGAYLDDLCADNPNSQVAYQLRVCSESNFYYCLVKRVTKEWSRESLVREGAIVIPN